MFTRDTKKSERENITDFSSRSRLYDNSNYDPIIKNPLNNHINTNYYSFNQQDIQFNPKKESSEEFTTKQNNIFRIFSKRFDNALSIFSLQRNYTEEQLMKSYKKLSLKYHPDRGGSSEMFSFIKSEKDFLLTNLQSMKSHKNDIDLIHNFKNNRKNHINNENNNEFHSKTMSQDKFNELFEKSRVETPYDIGYDQWMKSVNNVDRETEFNENINRNDNSSFNELFLKKKFSVKDKYQVENSNKHKEKWEIINEVKPLNLSINNDQCSNYGLCELEEKEVKDFTSHEYNFISDLKKVYSDATLVDERKAKLFIDENRTLDKLEKERSNVNYNYYYSPEEQNYINGLIHDRSFDVKRNQEIINFLDNIKK